MHIYHQDPEFIFYEMSDAVREARNGNSFQGHLTRFLARGYHAIYEASEIWQYDVDSELFTPYKSRSGTGNLISFFLARKQVNLYKVYDNTYCFATPKDSFIYNMKFLK